jgi:hypothetical protein
MFYIPIYFQSIQGTSAITSGVYNLPCVAFYALGVSVSLVSCIHTLKNEPELPLGIAFLFCLGLFDFLRL